MGTERKDLRMRFEGVLGPKAMGDARAGKVLPAPRRLSSGRGSGGGNCWSFRVLARATATAAALSTCDVRAMPLRSSTGGVAMARATASAASASQTGPGAGDPLQPPGGRSSPSSRLTSKRRSRKAPNEKEIGLDDDAERNRVRSKANAEEPRRHGDTEQTRREVDPNMPPTQSALEVDAVRDSSDMCKVAFFPGGGRGCSQSVPYLVKSPEKGGTRGGSSGPGGGATRAGDDAAAVAFVGGKPPFWAARMRGGGSGGQPWFASFKGDEEEEEGEDDGEDDRVVGEEEDDDDDDDAGVEREDEEGFSGGSSPAATAASTACAGESVGGDRRGARASAERRGQEGLPLTAEEGEEGEEGDEAAPERLSGVVACGGGDDAGEDGGGEGSDAGGTSTDGEESDEDGGSSPASDAEDADASLDVYKKTITRRLALKGVLAVARKALFRAVIMLIMFQVVPWLRDNPLVRWLLVVSLVLHTVDEVSRALSAVGSFQRSEQENGSDAGDARRTSQASKGSKGSNSGMGLLGGLLRVVNPEHEQHLEFYRLNDVFERDIEALAAASRSKTETAALLAASAAEESRMLGVNVMKAFMGFPGSRGDEAKGGGDSDAATGSKAKGKRKKRVKRETEACEERGEGTEEGSAERSGDEGSSSASPAGSGAEGIEGGRGKNSTEAASVQGAGDEEKADGVRKRVFVVNFQAGKMGTEDEQLELLSNAVGFLVSNGNSTTDEVVLCLESGGGEVTTYGLASAKLARLRDSGIRLTVCVDKVAASGGYMMACVADWLVVAPFAMLGSIGVLGGIPNFNKALRRAGIDYYHFTAGKNKSLVGPFQEVTRRHEVKQQQQLDSVHAAFKRHIRRYRRDVDVEVVGTGDVWLGLDALEVRLADEVGTAGQYLHRRLEDSDVFVVRPHQPRTMKGMSAVLRHLFLGPLASTRRFVASVFTIADALNRLATASAGDVSGAFPGFHNEGFWNSGRSVAPTGVFAAASGVVSANACGLGSTMYHRAREALGVADGGPCSWGDERNVLGGLWGGSDGQGGSDARSRDGTLW